MGKVFEDRAKARLINLKAHYAASPKINQSRDMMRADIDITAGIYNHDRALFDKGMRKFKKYPTGSLMSL